MATDQYFSRRIIKMLIICLALGAIALYFLTRKTSRQSEKIVFSEADGTIWQVVEYIKKPLIKHPDSFQAIHWSKLTKTVDMSGDSAYEVLLVYRIKNNEGKALMLSKLFELDKNGAIKFELDVAPFKDLNPIQ